MAIKDVIIIAIIISFVIIISIVYLAFVISKIYDIKTNKKKRNRHRD